MAIYTTLKQSESNEDVFPNIEIQNIPDSAIVTAKIADGAITAQKIANNSITQYKILDDAVISSKIVDGAITTSKLATWAVTTTKINDNAVTADKIATGAIVTAKIDDGAVTKSKLNIEVENNWPTSQWATLAEAFDDLSNAFANSGFIRFYYYDGSSYEKVEIVELSSLNIEIVIGSVTETITSDADAVSFFTSYMIPGYIYLVAIA